MSMRYPGGLIATSPVNARYPSGVWTQAQAAPYQAQNVWTRDQFWPYTTLLLQGDGAVNGAQNNTFLDSSSNNFTITRNGNTTQGSFTPYEQDGYWSNYFPSNSSLSFNYTSGIALGSTYTIECWINPSDVSQGFLFSMEQSNTGGFAYLSFYVSSGQIGAATRPSTNGTEYYNSAGSISVGVWQHVAIVNNAGTAQLYVNGVAVGTTFSMPAMSTTPSFVAIGQRANGFTPSGTYYTGYISNMRITTSVVYTGNFTPSTSPFSALANTKLLTCQSNRFVDNSTNAYALTASSASVEAFQPFPGATTWSASVLGGSGYFDAGGDYLSTNYTINWSTYGSYTLEFWIYHTTMSPTNQWYFVGGTGSTGNTVFYNYANGRVGVGIIGTNEITSAAGVIKANTWQHVAYTYNGTTTKIYVDGVEVASGTTAIYANSSVALSVGGGSASASDAMNGYMANLRLSQSVIYTTAFTPPTSPVTGGALLMNFTNAGIYDNSMMNNLETVGNAQVSTSVVKYGTGSMAFDGSGDYLVAPSRATTSLEGDFTIEYWIYRSVSGTTSIFTLGDSFTASGIETYIGSSGTAFLLFSGNATRISSSTLPAVGAWSHVAVVRLGSTITLYLNGISLGTWSSSTTFSGAVYVGTEFYNGSVSGSLNGYIDDLRITKGVARYIGNFTPPIARLPAQ